MSANTGPEDIKAVFRSIETFTDFVFTHTGWMEAHDVGKKDSFGTSYITTNLSHYDFYVWTLLVDSPDYDLLLMRARNKLAPKELEDTDEKA